jgi:hypothetical protein
MRATACAGIPRIGKRSQAFRLSAEEDIRYRRLTVRRGPVVCLVSQTDGLPRSTIGRLKGHFFCFLLLISKMIGGSYAEES